MKKLNLAKNNAHIVILEDSSQSQYGGGQRITEEIFKTIYELNTVTIIDTFDSELFKKISSIQAKECYKVSLSLKKYKNSFFLFNLLLFIKAIYFILRIKKQKIIYITTRKHLITACLAKILTPSSKLIYHYHLCTHRSFFWFLYDFLCLSFCHKIVFASQFVKDDFMQKRLSLFKLFTFKKILISPFPPAKWTQEELLNYPSIPTNPFTVAYIGKLSKDKGILTFFEAIKNLDVELKWKIVIAGDGPLKKELENKILENKDSRIVYLGSIDTNLAFFSTLSLVVIPSFDFIETIGLSALESIQAGLPVLVSSTGNLVNFSQYKNCHILLSENPKTIQAQITEEYKKLSSDNRRYILEKYEFIENEFIYFYQKLIRMD